MRVVLRTIRQRLKRFRRYHVGVIIRWEWLLRAIEPLLARGAMRVLDAASGDGTYAFRLARRYPQATFHGVELDAEKVRRCAKRLEKERLPNLTFEEGDLLDPRGKEEYHLVYSVDTLEHIGDDRKVLAHFAAALRPGGSLLAHVPLVPQRHWFRRFDLDRRRDPAHVREGYRIGELEEKARSAGLETVRVRYTHGRAGTLAWELWRIAERNALSRSLLYPAIRTLIALETTRRPTRGNCLLLEAQRPSLG